MCMYVELTIQYTYKSLIFNFQIIIKSIKLCLEYIYVGITFQYTNLADENLKMLRDVSLCWLVEYRLPWLVSYGIWLSNQEQLPCCNFEKKFPPPEIDRQIVPIIIVIFIDFPI